MKVDFGLGIVTRRLVNGSFSTIKDATTEDMKAKRQESLDAREREEIELQQRQMSKHQQVANTRIRKAIREAINESTEPRSIKNLR